MFAIMLRVPVPLLLAVFAFAFAGQAMARPEMAGGSAESRFAAIDADKDGKISREEFFAAQPQMKDSAFDAIDLDKDGSISLQEWVDFAKGHGSAMSPRGEGHDGAGQDGPGHDGSSRAPESEHRGRAMPDLIMPPAGP